MTSYLGSSTESSTTVQIDDENPLPSLPQESNTTSNQRSSSANNSDFKKALKSFRNSAETGLNHAQRGAIGERLRADSEEGVNSDTFEQIDAALKSGNNKVELSDYFDRNGSPTAKTKILDASNFLSPAWKGLWKGATVAIIAKTIDIAIKLLANPLQNQMGSSPLTSSNFLGANNIAASNKTNPFDTIGGLVPNSTSGLVPGTTGGGNSTDPVGNFGDFVPTGLVLGTSTGTAISAILGVGVSVGLMMHYAKKHRAELTTEVDKKSEQLDDVVRLSASQPSAERPAQQTRQSSLVQSTQSSSRGSGGENIEMVSRSSSVTESTVRKSTERKSLGRR